MNLIERLINGRLMNSASADGGEGGAPADAGTVSSGDGSQSTTFLSGSSQESDGEAGEESNGDHPGDEAGSEGSEGEKGEGDDKGKNDGAPEKYEFKAAEGQELDQAAIKEFEPIARELGLNNEQAQKLVDTYASKIVPQLQQQQMEAWKKTTEGWAEEVKADKEIGGDKLPASITAAQQALKQFGSPELMKYLGDTGLGNHPMLVKTFAKIGKAMAEDTMADGKNGEQLSAAQILYGKK